MKNSSGETTSGKLKLILLAVLTLSLGFYIGSIRYDYNLIGWAKTTPKLKNSSEANNLEKPEEAIETANKLESAFNYAARKVRPSVVSIISKTRVRQSPLPQEGFPGFRDPFFRRFFGPPRKRDVENLGSGVIISSDGYILTNKHVIEQADEIEVELREGKRVEAVVKATDPHTDLAVIKIDRTGLLPVDFGNSEEVQIGQYAIAIGAPFRYRDTVNVGHISALHRSIGTGRYEDLLQTDAAINPGNSGGPLINIEGKVIGINTAIATDGSRGNVGIGFAISSNMAKRTAEDLIEHGRPKRPWLGVKIQPVTPEMAQHFSHSRGALISEVASGSPADEVGLKPGDLIVEFGDQEVASPDKLQRLVLNQTVGDEVKVVVDREGETQSFEVSLAEVPSKKQGSSQGRPGTQGGILGNLGLVQIEEIPERRAAEDYNIEPPRTILKINKVEPGSAAHQQGLRNGDLIVEVNRRPVGGIEEFREFLSSQKEAGSNNVLLLVKHEGSYYWRVLPLN